MTADYLLIDVGNGRTKLAVATRERILEQRDTPTPGLSPDSLRAVLQDWDFHRIVLSSVVPDATETLRRFLPERLLVLQHDTPLGIGIRYPEPRTIGADRL